jgi:formylglycine-generating enzyme required for sulfatase activity
MYRTVLRITAAAVATALLSACAAPVLLPLPSTPTPALGDAWTRPADGMVMLYVPAGRFTMGSDREAINYARQLCKAYGGDIAIATCGPAAFANEGPAHTVSLDAFWIDRTEVTNGQYRRCEKAGACKPPQQLGSYTRDSYYRDDAYADYPVI